MNIWIHPYQLKPRQRLNNLSEGAARFGALIRVEFFDIGQYGHADIHPWVELGDESLEKQIEKLSRGALTPLTTQSLYLAREEAIAKDRKESLFKEQVHLKNNFILTDTLNFKAGDLSTLTDQGFEILKIKAGLYPSPEFAIIKEAQVLGMKVRLDFNSKLSQPYFEDYIRHFSSSVLQTVEYIEDPFSYDSASWSRLNRSIPLALDNEIRKFAELKTGDFESRVADDSAPFSVLIVKPARVHVDKALEECARWNVKATLTSYMDHPVGVLHAWAQAQKVKEKFPERVLQAGCATSHLYEEDQFSERISLNQAQIVPPLGKGLGLDDLLERLAWKKISSSN